MIAKRRVLPVLLVAALLVALWLLLPRGSRSQRPVLSPAVAAEFAKLQGTWEFVSMEVEGQKKPDAAFKKYTVVVKDDQWTVSEGTNIAAQTTLELDPTTNPKSVDIIPAPGKGALIHGIYTLEGDKLTVCDRGEDKGDRPTGFATEADSGLVLLVFRRVPR